MQYHWSVFTKPWKHREAHALAEHVASLGFDGIELPVRPDFQVEPDRAERNLPQFARVMREHGLSITSVASTIAEPVFAGCQAAEIPLIRIMIAGDPALSWQENLDHARQELDMALPLCEKYAVSVGVQHHYGFSIFHPMELKVLLARYDPRWIGGVWDAAHSALAGEPPKKRWTFWETICFSSISKMRTCAVSMVPKPPRPSTSPISRPARKAPPPGTRLPTHCA